MMPKLALGNCLFIAVLFLTNLMILFDDQVFLTKTVFLLSIVDTFVVVLVFNRIKYGRYLDGALPSGVVPVWLFYSYGILIGFCFLLYLLGRSFPIQQALSAVFLSLAFCFSLSIYRQETK